VQKESAINWKLIYKAKEELKGSGYDWKTLCSKIRKQLSEEGRKWMVMNPLPVLINRYTRKYLVSKEKNIRVTVDTNLTIYDQGRTSFPNYTTKSNIPRVLVVEIKFSRHLRNHVVLMFGDIPLRSSRFSKYVSGVLSISR
jgi:hypothetical protein